MWLYTGGKCPCSDSPFVLSIRPSLTALLMKAWAWFEELSCCNNLTVEIPCGPAVLTAMRSLASPTLPRLKRSKDLFSFFFFFNIQINSYLSTFNLCLASQSYASLRYGHWGRPSYRPSIAIALRPNSACLLNAFSRMSIISMSFTFLFL